MPTRLLLLALMDADPDFLDNSVSSASAPAAATDSCGHAGGAAANSGGEDGDSSPADESGSSGGGDADDPPLLLSPSPPRRGRPNTPSASFDPSASMGPASNAAAAVGAGAGAWAAFTSAHRNPPADSDCITGGGRRSSGQRRSEGIRGGERSSSAGGGGGGSEPADPLLRVAFVLVLAGAAALRPGSSRFSFPPLRLRRRESISIRATRSLVDVADWLFVRVAIGSQSLVVGPQRVD